MALDQAKKAELADIMAYRKKEANVLLTKQHNLNKNEFRNLERHMHIQRREEEAAASQLSAKQAIFNNEEELEKDKNLSRALDQMKRETFRDLKIRQSLRESSHELRELESKLRTAYVSKELAAQLAEREAKKIEQKLKEKHNYDIMQAAVLSQEEIYQRKAEEDIKKKAIYKQELQDQIILNEKLKRCSYEDFLREKKMIDDIVQRIHAEDERELEDRMCKMRKTREEMDSFKKAQQIWRNKEMEEIHQENKRIQEFLMRKAIEMQTIAQKKTEAIAQRGNVIDKISKQVEEKEMQRKEREELMMELQEEEKKQKQEQEYRAKVERSIRQRLEVRESLARQMVDRQERLKQEAAEDAKYKEEILIKMQEDERLELMSAQKRRMKMLQLRRDVEDMMVDKRQRRAEEMQVLMRLAEKEKLELDDRKRIIEQERLSMLQEHAKNLIGYLPKGVLRADDLPYLT